MLSRQVNDGSGYQDGAERLERKRSSMHQDNGLPSLQELEDISADPSSLMNRLSMDASNRNSIEALPDVAEGADMPILPPKPAGQGLKRSTKTTYRRGSQRKGERLAVGANLAFFFIAIILVPFTLFGTRYVYSLSFFTGWIVVSFIWVWTSMVICVIYPVVESTGALREVCSGLWQDAKALVGKSKPRRSGGGGSDA